LGIRTRQCRNKIERTALQKGQSDSDWPFCNAIELYFPDWIVYFEQTDEIAKEKHLMTSEPKSDASFLSMTSVSPKLGRKRQACRANQKKSQVKAVSIITQL
jgi:hypothetical protein